MRRFSLVILACLLAWIASPAQKKKKKEEETQTLQLPKELPAAVVGETRHLTYHVTPLSARGLLSQQVRDALKALGHDAGGESVLHIRAFVAGSGDLRRVRDLVSEAFTERHQSLPSLTLVQAGALPLEGSQVVLESVGVGKKETTPFGVAFISAQVATSDNPTDPVPPLTSKSLDALRRAVTAAGSEPADVLRVTCFFSTLDNLAASRQLVATEYPRASLNYIQTQRTPDRALAACEAVARLKSKPAARIQALNPEGLPREPGLSQVTLLSSERAVFTGSQSSFGYEEKDARLAFERLDKALEQTGVSLRDVACARYYPLSGGIATQIRKVRQDIFPQAQSPAGSLLLFEGLPGMDSGFAVDVVAAKD